MPATNTIINNQTTPFIVNGNMLDGELRDIQGFQAIAVPEWIWWSLLVLTLALAGWLVYKYLKNRQVELELTLTELTVKQLGDLNLQNKSKEFYLDFSELVRIFLEGRLGMHVLDKTAEEIRPILISEHRIMTTQALILSKILCRADLAKFAKQEFSSEIKAKDIEATIAIIKNIDSLLKVAEEKKEEQELRGYDAVR